MAIAFDASNAVRLERAAVQARGVKGDASVCTASPFLRKHRPDYESLGPQPRPPHEAPKFSEPYNKDTVLEYVSFCQEQVAEHVPQLDLEAESGFFWLPFSKLELQIYTIRHLQQHAGELMERLGRRAGVEIDWVGTKNG